MIALISFGLFFIHKCPRWGSHMSLPISSLQLRSRKPAWLWVFLQGISLQHTLWTVQDPWDSCRSQRGEGHNQAAASNLKRGKRSPDALYRWCEEGCWEEGDSTGRGKVFCQSRLPHWGTTQSVTLPPPNQRLLNVSPNPTVTAGL